MPICDIVANSDLTNPGGVGKKEKECPCPVFPPHPHPEPPVPPAPYPYPYPPVAYLVPPPPPYYPKPDEGGDDNPSVKPNATERSICKLSKKAAALRSLIENIQDKNKPVIIKSSAVSYNLGTFKTKDPEDPAIYIEDENIETIINILKAELEKIKEEIKELSDELVED